MSSVPFNWLYNWWESWTTTTSRPAGKPWCYKPTLSSNSYSQMATLQHLISLEKTSGEWPRSVWKMQRLWRRLYPQTIWGIGVFRSHPQGNSGHGDGSQFSSQFSSHPGGSQGRQAFGNKVKKVEAKEMAKQHKDCFSLYANVINFSKSHFTNSCDRHTDTPHTCSHQHPMKCPRLTGSVACSPPNWEGLTQVQLVLQTVGGYQLELKTVPYQAYVPHQIKCSPDSITEITTEVLELQAKGAITETQLTKQNYVSQVRVGGRKETSDKPTGSQSVSEARALQDGSLKTGC